VLAGYRIGKENFQTAEFSKREKKNKKKKKEGEKREKRKEEKKVQVLYFVTKRYYSTVIKDTSIIVFCISYHRSHNCSHKQ